MILYHGSDTDNTPEKYILDDISETQGEIFKEV